jgi:SpoVK/Ycf46/Vps4 family AAA+-type ATPase
LIKKLLAQVDNNLRTSELDQIAGSSNGYSSADLTSLVKEAVMEPIRELPPGQLLQLKNAK